MTIIEKLSGQPTFVTSKFSSYTSVWLREWVIWFGQPAFCLPISKLILKPDKL